MAETAVELIAEGTDITTHLTGNEKFRLGQCEQIIKNGFNTFIMVGKALADIRDKRLYRETHKAFEKYCKDVWDLSRGYAHRQIDSYQTVQTLEQKCCQLATLFVKNNDSNSENDHKKCRDCEWKKAMANKAKGVKIGMAEGKCTRPEGLCEEHVLVDEADPEKIILPINEAQTRPLTKLKNPDDQVKAWGIVLNMLNEDPKRKLTAALINKAVKEVRGKVVKKKIKDTKKAVDATSLLSKQFKNQHQVMLDIIVAEKNSEWVTSKRKEVIKWMKALVSIAESDD